MAEWTLWLDGRQDDAAVDPFRWRAVLENMETLSISFQKSQGAPIEWGGKLVFPIFQRKLSGQGTRMRVKRISQNPSIV